MDETIKKKKSLAVLIIIAVIAIIAIAIIAVTVVKNGNPEYKLKKQLEIADKYLAELIIQPTAYSTQQGVDSFLITEEVYSEDAWDLVSRNYSRDCIGCTGAIWWLRSPSYESDDACYIPYDGCAGWYNYYYVDNYSGGVRPALYITE